jgi:hypothetical protein
LKSHWHLEYDPTDTASLLSQIIPMIISGPTEAMQYQGRAVVLDQVSSGKQFWMNRPADL